MPSTWTSGVFPDAVENARPRAGGIACGCACQLRHNRLSLNGWSPSDIQLMCKWNRTCSVLRPSIPRRWPSEPTRDPRADCLAGAGAWRGDRRAGADGRLGIGRTPVREALRRLAQERLVEVYPRRGMFVTGVDVRDLARLSEVRACSSRGRAARRRAGDRRRPARVRRAARRARAAGGRDERSLDGARRTDPPRSSTACAHNDLLEATLEQYYVLALRIWFARPRPGRRARGRRAGAPRAARGDPRRRRRARREADARPRPGFEQAMRVRVLLIRREEILRMSRPFPAAAARAS